MIQVSVVMVLGGFVGFLIRKRAKLIAINDKLIMIAIFVLLFFMGISIGGNHKIMSNLPVLGLKSLIIAIGGVLGSAVVSYFIYKLFFKTKKNHK